MKVRAKEMNKEKHHKHPNIQRKHIGQYHHIEWSIYGTTCSAIKAFYHQLVDHWDEVSIGLVDADHGEPKMNIQLQRQEKIIHLPDHSNWNKFDDQFALNDASLVLVNGNHYPASRQIIVLNEVKDGSLERRLDQLTNVDAVLLDERGMIPEFLRPRIKAETKVFDQDDLSGLFTFLKDEYQRKSPTLKALVLAGGKSKRMGEDKSKITYRAGKEQQHFIADCCKSLGIETFISKGIDFDQEELHGYPVIKDKMEGMGPFGAILSAFLYDPNASWLVLACDLPFLDATSIGDIIQQRSTAHLATAVIGKDNPFPEPLIAIYESSIYQRMLQFLSHGYACPRKVLINSNVHLIPVDDDKLITNVNTPEEKVVTFQKLKGLG